MTCHDDFHAWWSIGDELNNLGFGEHFSIDCVNNLVKYNHVVLFGQGKCDTVVKIPLKIFAAWAFSFSFIWNVNLRSAGQSVRVTFSVWLRTWRSPENSVLKIAQTAPWGYCLPPWRQFLQRLWFCPYRHQNTNVSLSVIPFHKTAQLTKWNPLYTIV